MDDIDRFSEWDEFSDRSENDHKEGEERECLLDPNLPEKDAVEGQRPASAGSAMFGDDASIEVAEELEDSPYEEVRAAVRNYDEDLPCNTILAQLIFYKQDFGIMFQLLLTISTQSLGYGIAGMMRKFLVVNQLFGGMTGLSLLPITFDWTQIAGYVGSPLIPPWHAIGNTLIGVVGFYIVLAVIFHYSGMWYSQYLPISDSSTYDNTGAPYNVSRVLSPDFRLDEDAYKSYSPLFISTTFALSYGLSFAAISSLVVYTYLHHRKTIWAQYQNSTNEKPDIHMKLMRKYIEAPTSWYMSLFGVVLLLGFIAVLGYPTNLTWWAFLLAVAISFVFALPIGIIQAVTNNQIGLNVLTEFIYGYIQPGRPLALMMAQALSFVEDLKFGHYMKIPPRTMFMCQVVATTFSCFIQIAVLNLALKNIDGVCEVTQPERFTCPGGRVFFSASVIWGLIGPARVFSPGQIYSGLMVFFFVGAVTPIAIYLAAKRWPRSPAKYLMAPLIFGGASAIPPATPLNYLSWGIVGYIFQYRIKKKYFGWWSRLCYLTSSGLDLGLALSTLFIFFALTLTEIGPPQWWGNTVVTSTMDFQGTAVEVKLPPGEIFGPRVW
ncbi:hypothetical protein DL766_000226 [Monosporascus sp. MC13-8B]|uniref:OPT family small oligopeptide transporter n=1 Tax=Monosporascus cannonballus TaxID=155416 RepID=A0ABY0GWS5_9PEZI|nr:hypothetical protein DL762_009354 [Monosporascus cannonballus]RYP39784.1 hypothetical protein DL766_000226 [Monosporascus sp. MC13-8B]